MRKVRRWRPDTCGCVLLHEWDTDNLPDPAMVPVAAEPKFELVPDADGQAAEDAAWAARQDAYHDTLAAQRGMTRDQLRQAALAADTELPVDPAGTRQPQRIMKRGRQVGTHRTRACRVHLQHVADPAALAAVVGEENQRKNRGVGAVATELSLTVDDVAWTFDDQTTPRVLHLAVPAGQSANSRRAAQAALDALFGAGLAVLD